MEKIETENGIPAPWKLKGEGYILLYRFKRDFVERNGFLPEAFKGCFTGGIGAVMIVDYQESNAGPYRELLFIPGIFNTGYTRRHSITKIYVSTQTSVDNGRRNWAIPKELADFTITDCDNREQRVSIKGNNSIFKARLKCFGLPFPVWTGLLPFPLQQMRNDRLFLTTFRGIGWGRLARIKDCESAETHFPDLSGQKPLAVIRVKPFRITFPKSKIIDLKDRT